MDLEVILFCVVGLLAIVICYIFFIYKKHDQIDGIMAIMETPNGASIKFILCIPIDEFMERKIVKMEVKHISDPELYEELSQ